MILLPCLLASWVGSYQMDDIKSLVTRFYDTWNARDRDGWLACCYEDITFTGPGGVGGQGFDAARMFWSLGRTHFQRTGARLTSRSQRGTRPSRNRSSQARTRKHSACQTVKTFPRRGRAWQFPIRWASLTLVASGQASGFSSTERSSWLNWGSCRARAGLYSGLGSKWAFPLLIVYYVPVSFAGQSPRMARAWSPVRSQARSRRAAAWLACPARLRTLVTVLAMAANSRGDCPARSREASSPRVVSRRW